MFINLTLDNDNINRRYLIAVDDISVVEEVGESSYIMLKGGSCLSVKESIDYIKSLLDNVKWKVKIDFGCGTSLIPGSFLILLIAKVLLHSDISWWIVLVHS